ncbi:hypothetical protein LIER_10350 [Lithospermum erythrorhizon]|uniref:Uncharacterized protein n=1 Tax=Lithospermum erythrorhizon TaxID=34254 RepID=A0AAV3PKD3_LITER
MDTEQANTNRTRLSRSLVGLIRDSEFFTAVRVQENTTIYLFDPEKVSDNSNESHNSNDDSDDFNNGAPIIAQNDNPITPSLILKRSSELDSINGLGLFNFTNSSISAGTPSADSKLKKVLGVSLVFFMEYWFLNDWTDEIYMAESNRVTIGSKRRKLPQEIEEQDLVLSQQKDENS